MFQRGGLKNLPNLPTDCTKKLPMVGGQGSKKCENLPMVPLLNDVNKLFDFKSLLKRPSNAMFCLYTSSNFSSPQFEFSLKVKVMGSNPGYLLKPFYFMIFSLKSTMNSYRKKLSKNAPSERKSTHCQPKQFLFSLFIGFIWAQLR